MTATSNRRRTTQSHLSQSSIARLSTTFWRLASAEQQTELRDPNAVARYWLSALDGLEGKRQDREVAKDALSFLMRLESDRFYASPEQSRGGDKDSQALVYSLGLLFFEQLTGHHPFVESLSPLESRIVRDRAKRVGTNNLCSVPESLRRILSKALSPFPEDRFADLQEMRQAVESWLRSGAGQCVLAQGSATRNASSARAPQMPRVARGTTPPPVPAPRPRFVPADTLEAAVNVRPTTTVPTAAPSSSTPWLWPSISAGFALVAVVAMLITMKGQKSPVASPQAAQPTAALAAAHTSEAESSVPSKPAQNAAVLAANTDATSTELDSEELAAPTGDTTLGADEQVVAVVRECVSESSLVGGINMGISIKYDADGLAQKIFTGKLPVAQEDLRCVKEMLESVSTEIPDHRSRIVSYDLWVSLEGERVRARLPKH